MARKRNNKINKNSMLKKGNTVQGKQDEVAVAYTRVNTTGAPMMSRSGPKLEDIRVRHREYLLDVLSQDGSTFGCMSIPIQPGDPNAFPWLATIANSFESYEVHDLAYGFETEQGSGYPGSVMLAIDYDSLDPLPASKQQMMGYRGAVRTAPWKNCTYRALRSELVKRKDKYIQPSGYTLPGSLAVSAAGDPRLSVLGNLIIATAGNTTTGDILGELYVEYDILLKTPSLDSAFQYLSMAGGPGLTTTAPWGSAPVVNGTIPVSYQTPGGVGTFTIGPGEYFVAWDYNGTGLNAGAQGGLVIIGNSIGVQNLQGTNATTTTTAFAQFSVPGQGVFKITPTTGTTITSSILYIVPFPINQQASGLRSTFRSSQSLHLTTKMKDILQPCPTPLLQPDHAPMAEVLCTVVTDRLEKSVEFNDLLKAFIKENVSKGNMCDHYKCHHHLKEDGRSYKGCTLPHILTNEDFW
jgi:hypothetical protein